MVDPLRYWIALTMVDGLLRATALRLLKRFGSPEIFFKGGEDELPPAAARAIRGFNGWERVAREIDLVRKGGVRVVTLNDPEYPPLLKEISDPPLILYTKGVFEAVNTGVAVAVEGTRRPTASALKNAGALSRGLASRGAAVVSGMARGCDAAAHRGALGAGGVTVAVLGTGIDVPYPAQNKRLYREITEAGLVISELPMGTGPVPKNFLRRNRIINGISRGIVVIEANLRSGSMMTARLAFELGRKVFVVAGDLNPAMEKLVERGAITARSADGILDKL